MTIEYSVKVTIGGRGSNDDRALIAGRIHDMDLEQGELALPCTAVVCDGCGGYDGGYEAAETVLETLRGEDPELLLNEEYLQEVLTRCREAVFQKKEEMPQFSSMCTAIAGCVFGEDRTIIFHAGDSRVYRFDGKYLARMTKDHSKVQAMVDMGQITEEEALVSSERNIISRCIGIDCLPPEIYVSNTPILPGETYLICSDGLWEGLSKDEMAELLASGLELHELAETLADRAMENGSDDNISVCICSRKGNGERREQEQFVLD